MYETEEIPNVQFDTAQFPAVRRRRAWPRYVPAGIFTAIIVTGIIGIMARPDQNPSDRVPITDDPAQTVVKQDGRKTSTIRVKPGRDKAPVPRTTAWDASSYSPKEEKPKDVRKDTDEKVAAPGATSATTVLTRPTSTTAVPTTTEPPVTASTTTTTQGRPPEEMTS